MKIKRLTVQNYKKFVQPQTINFTDNSGNVNEVTLIIGNNGSGKTSILQAIVILLGKITRENFDPQTLDWLGFEYRNLQTGKFPLKIEAEVIFVDEEISTTQEYAKQLSDLGAKVNMPSNQKSVVLTFDYNKCKTISKNGSASFYQFHGYQYAKRLAKLTIKSDKLFENVGNIYWYTEQRTSNNISNLLDNKKPDLDDIRSFLASAYNYHVAIQNNSRQMKEGEFDFYDKLKSLYETVFPGRTFVGSIPSFDLYEKAKASDFILYDSHNQYELSGMSAGERAIFPILMDFTRWNINNSIVIIDELELHLHPPLQQSFIRALPKMGKNNQFILTSHSNSVASMFNESENQIIRLPNE